MSTAPSELTETPFCLVGATQALAHPSAPAQRLLEIAKTWLDKPQHSGSPTRTICRTARQLNPDEVDALVDAHRSGLTVYQIAQQFGMHRSAVGRHLAARDVHTRQLVLSPTEIHEATELYRSGQRLKDLAERYASA